MLILDRLRRIWRWYPGNEVVRKAKDGMIAVVLLPTKWKCLDYTQAEDTGLKVTYTKCQIFCKGIPVRPKVLIQDDVIAAKQGKKEVHPQNQRTQLGLTISDPKFAKEQIVASMKIDIFIRKSLLMWKSQLQTLSVSKSTSALP